MSISMRLFFCAVLAILLAGCDHQAKRQSLEEYIQEVKAREPVQIEPLPEVKPYETFTYAALKMRSPFKIPVPEQKIVNLPKDNGIRPDTNRRKEPLESFPLDSLKMVGTIEKENALWAIIVDQTGTVYRIKKGNYIGLNHGQVEKISEEKMAIKEIVPDPRGGWQEKDAAMTLTEEPKSAQVQ